MKISGVLDTLAAPWRHNAVDMINKLVRTKDPRGLQGDQGRSEAKLKKCLGTLDLTSLGVGSCCGTGMYLVAGMVARNVAGPGVIISFMIAAIASLFSGACYAEFGVRVPHTTGSAYVYSYVTVGEFLAFVIGWNMILEYLIGTSACACALSASFDSLSGGAINRGIAEHVGTILGRAPDFIALGITLLMTGVLALGASKSVLFNHALNAINLSAWTFIMAAGLFYADASTWSEHEGFLPFGWSGVFTGAATCFYAFIGFDIIATTGEEAMSPQRSIPRAIFASLVIVLIAYVSSSLMMTLIVPYDQIDAESALVQMFGQVGAWRCRIIVGIGAAAGLGVAMFGSMFPMPRVIYAMAQDGLIFKQLAHIWPFSGTPGLATLGSGLAAALVALFVRLEVLVEMMSIGTLLAYTLVSTCVLVLRYQPHSTSLVELLPPVLRTPQPPATPSCPGNTNPSFEMSPRLDSMSTQKVMVRRVTRSSPDSDDTFSEECDDGMMGTNNEFAIRDDQFLIADRLENKFYGSVHGGSTTPNILNTGPLARVYQAISQLCPSMFPWVHPGPATTETGMYVVKLVGIMFLLIFIMDLTAAAGSGTFAATVITLSSLAIVAVLVLISKQPQNRHALAFLTPGLPVVPAIAVLVNIYLIMKLSILTLVRFTVWMSLGIIMYFYYGITNSKLEQPVEPELKVTEDALPENKVQNKFASPINVYSNHMANVELNSGWGDESSYGLSNTSVSGRLDYENRAFDGSHFGVIDSNAANTQSNSRMTPFNAWDD